MGLHLALPPGHGYCCCPSLLPLRMTYRIRASLLWSYLTFSQFSCSVMSHSLQTHGLQHSRLPCPSPTLGDCSNSCPLSQWCHPTISSSVVPFSSCLQSFPASGSFPVSQFLASGGQSFGASASASVLPKNSQDWLPLGLTGLISLQSKGLSRVFSNTIVPKHQFFGSVFFMVQLSHPYMTTGKTIALTRRTFVGKVMSLLFNHLLKVPFPNKVLGFRTSVYKWGGVHEPAHNRWPEEVGLQ